MAGAMKYWRESASLMLASKRVAGAASAIKPKKDRNFKKLFPVKESKLKEDNKLNLLFVKRSTESKYMPNVHVFPGGMIDDHDFSQDWLELFRFNTPTELMDLLSYGKVGSPIYSRERDAEFSTVPAEIGLRITAIRETFEESGVLLARSCEDLEQNGTHELGKPSPGNIFNNNVSEGDLQKWREKVNGNSSEFLNMCKEFEAIPDIWSLYEWSNWLTPLLTTRTHRFDTAFFVSCIDEGPLIVPSIGETDQGIWMQPFPMLQAFQMGLTSIAPPQMYELCRLARLDGVDDLMSLSCHRAKHRSNRWIPVVMPCQNGLMFILPGDDMYPQDPDLTGEQDRYNNREETFEELCVKYPRHNRAFIDNEKNMSLLCNLEYLDSHILPMNFNKVKNPTDLFETRADK